MRKVKQTLGAKLRNAERRNAELQKQVNGLSALVQRMTVEYSGTSIITGLTLDDVAKTAVNTARRLGFIVVVAPDSSNQGKFALRAHSNPND